MCKYISVVIILYHSKHLIPQILFNVKQTIKSLGEIILVNNSREDIDEFKSDVVSVIYPPSNLGYGGGINLGVEHIRYEYLLILNPDLHIMEFNPSIKDLKNEIIISGHNPNMSGYSFKFPNLYSTFIENTLMQLIYIKFIDKLIHYKKIKAGSENTNVDYVSGALILTNKSTFKKIGGFDPTFFLFYEETDFCRRAIALNIPIICTSNIVFRHTPWKSSSINVDKIKIKAGIESSKFYHFKYNNKTATKFTFMSLRIIYILIIWFLYLISFTNSKLKIKKDEFAYRLKFI